MATLRMVVVFVAFFVVMVILNLILSNENPSTTKASTTSEPGSDCFTNEMTSMNMLSIHLVIIPFLQFKTTNEMILKRLEEYKYVLQRNLAHPLVQCVHILTTNSTETLEMLNDLPHQNRVLVSEVESIDLARDPFHYISRKLLGRDVIFTNADIYLGEGFEQADPIVMDTQKIMYAVTRRLAPVECNSDKLSSPTWNCQHYIGSHDSFLFRLHDPLTEKFLKQLNFDLVSPGMENVVIDLFRKELGYCVLNPCAILETFHYHCSNLRNHAGKPRVNRPKEQHGLAGFTKQLKCT